jgi:membrane protease YdiL (CAAX protease family)
VNERRPREDLALARNLRRPHGASRLGVAGLIVLTAAIFAAAHVPDDPVYAFGLLTGGLILGLVCWLSGFPWSCMQSGTWEF